MQWVSPRPVNKEHTSKGGGENSTDLLAQPHFSSWRGFLCTFIGNRTAWTWRGQRLVKLNDLRRAGFGDRPLPISMAFLVLISFARLAINCDCSQATIILFHEWSIVAWKQWAETSCVSFPIYSETWLHLLPSSAWLCQSTHVFRKPTHAYRSEFLQDRMLPQGVVENVLNQWVSLSLTVTFGDAHSGRFIFPWGQTMKQL